jgi:glycosyltransferase involved in cell wall biosynthesis
MITVLMATRNRAAILGEVLERYATVEAPRHGWKLVVVDNGSRDQTRQTVEAFVGRIPVAYVLEETPGKNAALRTGFPRAEGDLLILTDDDVLPCHDYLLQYEAAAKRLPAFDMFGGPVLLRWHHPPEPWMTENPEILGPTFAATLRSWREGPITQVLFGGNFAVRRALLRAEDFNPAIGPVEGISFAMGEEAVLQRRLELRGCRKYWLEGATVEHIIRPEQMDRKWVLRRAIRYGKGMYRQAALNGEKAYSIWGIPRWAIRRYITEASRFAVAWARGRSQAALEARWKMNQIWGYMEEARKTHYQARPGRDSTTKSLPRTQGS